MAVLTATEKLKILALGKATLKEINELEAEAAAEPEPQPEPTPEPQQEPQPEPTPEPQPEPQPDEKDLKIVELEEKLKEAQANNVHKEIGGSEPSFDEQLDDMFKGYRF